MSVSFLYTSDIKKYLPNREFFWLFWSMLTAMILSLFIFIMTRNVDFVIISVVTLCSTLILLPAYWRLNVCGYAIICWQTELSNKFNFLLVPNQEKYWSYEYLQKDQNFSVDSFYLIFSLGGWKKRGMLLSPGLAPNSYCEVSCHFLNERMVKLSVTGLYRSNADSPEIMTPGKLLQEAKSRYQLQQQRIQEAIELNAKRAKENEDAENAEKLVDDLAKTCDIQRADPKNR